MDKSVALFSVESGEEIYRFKGHHSEAVTAIFNKEASLLFTGSEDWFVFY